MCSQQSKASGLACNIAISCKLEQLVINAVLAAEQIADGHVSLPTQPEQSALETSQTKQSVRYRVTDACTDSHLQLPSRHSGLLVQAQGEGHWSSHPM